MKDIDKTWQHCWGSQQQSAKQRAYGSTQHILQPLDYSRGPEGPQQISPWRWWWPHWPYPDVPRFIVVRHRVRFWMVMWLRMVVWFRMVMWFMMVRFMMMGLMMGMGVPALSRESVDLKVMSEIALVTIDDGHKHYGEGMAQKQT